MIKGLVLKELLARADEGRLPSHHPEISCDLPKGPAIR